MTGYVVHYSHGVDNTTNSNMTDSNMTASKRVPASSTHALITNLTKYYNYTFSVEATSEHLSGKSKISIFKLGMELQLIESNYLIIEPIRVSINSFIYPSL